MLKMIKTKKQMRLDELIKYVWDNGLNSCQFTSDNNVDVYFSSNEHFLIAGDSNGNGRSVELVDTFTVEIEEPITEDTVFETLVEIQKDEQVNLWFDTNIVTYRNAGTSKFYALINGRLELVWERDEDE